jgi:hypothetical protein
MRKRTKSDKISIARRSMKKQKQPKGRRQNKLEQQYQQLFTPYLLPYQGLYTDADSLEQPSALKYVPTTATPNVEA